MSPGTGGRNPSSSEICTSLQSRNVQSGSALIRVYLPRPSRCRRHLHNLVEGNPVQCFPQLLDQPVVPLLPVFIPPVRPDTRKVILIRVGKGVGRWGEALRLDEVGE